MECGGLTAATTISTTLDDLFSSSNTEVDVGMEWLSIFVEDCLSSNGSCLPPPKAIAGPTKTSDQTSPSYLRKGQNVPPSFDAFAVAGKARSKRKRIAPANSKAPSTTPWSQALHHFPGSDPPLLDQAYWLADSELLAPKTAAAAAAQEDGKGEEKEEEKPRRKNKYMAAQRAEEEGEEEEVKGIRGGNTVVLQPRRCTHCLSQRTPQWRAGPLGPKTLCNACGVRYKSGRLLPEYRPAKSPTFVSYLHSNSHKKVMEMRNGMGIGTGMGTEMVSSIPADDESGR